MFEIMEVANRHNIPVIEDAAQAIGAELQGKKAGSFGLAGCFSFFPSKNLGGFGDGGMVVTNDDAFAEKLQILRAHGSRPKYYHKIIGGNFRLDALQAGVLNVKLKYLNEWTGARRKNAADYDAMLEKAGLVPDKVTLPTRVDPGHIFNQYVIKVQDRDGLKASLLANDIGTEIYYPVPLHLQECFADLGGKEGDCPVAEAAADSTLALPIYPELSREQKEFVAETIANFYS
jgi:dTDP-4-amino-4,6-dideoxygalactose transaminase